MNVSADEIRYAKYSLTVFIDKHHMQVFQTPHYNPREHYTEFKAGYRIAIDADFCGPS